MRRDIFRVLLVILVVLAFLIAPSFLAGGKTALANGAAHAVVKNAKAGPYELQVSILPGIPKVGNLHLSILVKNVEAGTTITDATVTVEATGPAGATNLNPVKATNTLQSPQFYDLDMNLDKEGRWTLIVVTDSALGKASLGLSLEVSPSGGFNMLWIAVGVVASLTLGFGVWDRIHSRRRGNRKEVSKS